MFSIQRRVETISLYFLATQLASTSDLSNTKLFSMFVSKDSGGTGVGLYVSRKYC